VFRRDCDRIIHSASFRRLKHKTQVFVAHEGDHYRTRLTHTLEVSQIARSLARALGLDEDLAEALALGHDLGHPPFGHAGEDALAVCLAASGGFDHNVQTLRVVTELERRYAGFDGLNLTWETLEGLLKHNGPLPIEDDSHPLVRMAAQFEIPAAGYGTAEAQAAAVADDIAYDAHDLDDGLRAEMFAIEELRTVPFLARILDEIAGRHGDIEPARRVHELIRRVITQMIEDVVASSQRQFAALAPQSADDVRQAGAPVVGFSSAMTETDRSIKAFLFPRMYRHPRIQRVTDEARAVVGELFGHFSANPEDLPTDWRTGIESAGAHAKARRIGDFIAGMTDTFALAEHARYFDSSPKLR
jgi:dGTPase